VDDAQDGEPCKGPRVREGAARREAAPAFVAADECCVGDQEQEGEPVGDARCDGGGVETQVEGVDEEVVEGCIEGGGDEENVRSGAVDFWWCCYKRLEKDMALSNRGEQKEEKKECLP
jgi:hypothetical protein